MPKHIKKQSARKWGDRIPVYLTHGEDKYLGIKSSENQTANISLKYFDHNYQCFSEWDRDELREFSRFVEKLRNLTWTAIPRNRGLGMQPHKIRKKLPSSAILNSISKDTSLFELRVTGESRVHGFRVKSTFFLVWLDRQHDIYPM